MENELNNSALAKASDTILANNAVTAVSPIAPGNLLIRPGPRRGGKAFARKRVKTARKIRQRERAPWVDAYFPYQITRKKCSLSLMPPPHDLICDKTRLRKRPAKVHYFDRANWVHSPKCLCLLLPVPP